MPAPEAKLPKKSLVQLGGTPERITNRTFGIRVLAPADLFAAEVVEVRVVITVGGEQAGQTGMAVSAELDRTAGVLRLKPGTEASVGLMLTREDCATVRIVVMDPNTDAVIDQSDEIPVSLGI
jgi:hypothetical protein